MFRPLTAFAALLAMASPTLGAPTPDKQGGGGTNYADCKWNFNGYTLEMFFEVDATGPWITGSGPENFRSHLKRECHVISNYRVEHPEGVDVEYAEVHFQVDYADVLPTTTQCVENAIWSATYPHITGLKCREDWS